MSRTSWKNKLAGFVAAGAIVAGLFPVTALGAGAMTLDPKISVSGLDEGDTAQYYQILEQSFSTYVKATEFDASATYYTKVGNNYTGAYGVTADNFGDGEYYTLTPPPATQDWKLSASVDSDGNGIVDGTDGVSFTYKDDTGADKTVTGLRATDLVIGDTNRVDKRLITFDMANAIALAVSNNGADPVTSDPLTADANGKVEVEGAQPGLYMFVASPGTANTDTVYKPVFVSADYYSSNTEGDDSYPDDKTDTIGLVADKTDYADNQGVFKRSPLSIDKKSGQVDAQGNVTDEQHDVAVGDVVDFTITVPLPTYTKNFESPVFKITDVLTEGLELCDADGTLLTAGIDADNIDVSVNLDDDDNTEVTAIRYTSDANNADYKVTVTNTKEFVVEFMNDKNISANSDGKGGPADDKDGFLYTTVGAPTVTITYKAKVTSKAAQQINQMDNTATLKFTNKVEDTTGAGELKDKTRHYTFDLDATVFGGTAQTGGNEGQTSELRKVAIDANGNVIQEEIVSDIVKKNDEESTKHNWLEGAEFELKKIKKHVNLDSVDQTTGEFNCEMQDITPEVIKFDENGLKVATGGGNAKSDENGYIPMKGLDAGVYELTEVKAPLGYAFNPNIKYTITIEPVYVQEPNGTTDDGLTGGGDAILKEYTVTISTQKLDDNLNPVEGETVTTSCTYTAGQDATGNPISFLNDGGTQNEDATITYEATGDDANTSALIVNKKLGLLPATGGSGIYFYLVVGGAIAAVAAFLMNKTKKQIEAAE